MSGNIHLDQSFEGKESVEMFDDPIIYLCLLCLFSVMYLSKLRLGCTWRLRYFCSVMNREPLKNNWMIKIFHFTWNNNFICSFIRFGVGRHFSLIGQWFRSAADFLHNRLGHCLKVAHPLRYRSLYLSPTVVCQEVGWARLAGHSGQRWARKTFKRLSRWYLLTSYWGGCVRVQYMYPMITS